MKTNNWQKILAAVLVAGVAVSGSTALAQSSVTAPAPAVSTPAPQPQMAYGVAEIVQLTQAKISDDTIVAYIKNSGLGYSLDANQIIYLRQQGVSDAVITMMLNQPRTGMSNPAPAPAAPPQATYTPPATYAPPADTTASAVAPAATTAVAPPVTYVQTVPSYYYSSPYYYPSYGYYSGYYYPPVSLSFGWGWGGGWRGGWGGGWHGRRWLAWWRRMAWSLIPS